MYRFEKRTLVKDLDTKDFQLSSPHFSQSWLTRKNIFFFFSFLCVNARREKMNKEKRKTKASHFRGFSSPFLFVVSWRINESILIRSLKTRIFLAFFSPPKLQSNKVLFQRLILTYDVWRFSTDLTKYPRKEIKVAAGWSWHISSQFSFSFSQATLKPAHQKSSTLQ